MSNFLVGILVLVGLLGTVFLLRAILSGSGKSKEVFEAVDGTKLSSKTELYEYEFLYERLKGIYEEKTSSNKSKSNISLGLNKKFLQQIKSTGFANPNELITNREQFKKLVELFDTTAIESDKR